MFACLLALKCLCTVGVTSQKVVCCLVGSSCVHITCWRVAIEAWSAMPKLFLTGIFSTLKTFCDGGFPGMARYTLVLNAVMVLETRKRNAFWNSLPCYRNNLHLLGYINQSQRLFNWFFSPWKDVVFTLSNHHIVDITKGFGLP